MKLLDTTPKRVESILNSLRNLVEDEFENCAHTKGRPYSPIEDLQYVLFQRAMKDAVQGLAVAHYVSCMTDKEITDMCADAGVTVEGAIVNAMCKSFMEMMRADFEDTDEE